MSTMSKRSCSALSRTYRALRRFLSQAWISRIAVADWLAEVVEEAPSSKSKKDTQLGIEPFSERNSPDDPVGVLQSGFMGAAGTLLTPGLVALKGWAAGHVADTRVEANAPLNVQQAVTAVAAPPPAPVPFSGASTRSQVDSSVTATPPVANTPVDSLAAANNGNMTTLGATPADDWLSAVGDVLGDSASVHHPKGGGGGSGGGGPGTNGTAVGAGGADAAPFWSYPGMGTAAANDGSSGAQLALTAGMLGSSTAPASTVTAQPVTTPLVPAISSPSVAQPTSSGANLLTSYLNAPLAFQPNVGQTSAQVSYLALGSGLSVFLTESGAVLAMPRASQPPANGQAGVEDVLGLQFTGANPDPTITAQDDLLSRSNYFTAGQSLTNIPNYAQLTYENLYPGIDLVFHQAANGGHEVEYDFVVHPGASPSEIHLTWQGAQSISSDAQSDLVLKTGGGQLVESAPSVYQGGTTAHVAVQGSNLVAAGGQLSFQVGSYDTTKDLVIDPAFSYSSYLGGTGATAANAIAVDANGSAYITGSAASGANFPTSTGAFQSTAGSSNTAFVAKIAPNGTLVYSTYLGGSSSGDVGNAIATDAMGNAYVAGYAVSSNFPTTTGAYQTSGSQSAFVSKLNPTGSALDYSTFLGAATTKAQAIAVDPLGNAYVTGQTTSSTFPTTTGAFQGTRNAATQAFVTKINSSGSALTYSSYLGGTSTAVGQGIALGQPSSGTYPAYVTGYTSGGGFTTTAGSFKTTAPNTTKTGFVSEINGTGTTTTYSTYLGGSTTDAGNAIAVDVQGDAYITGLTQSSNFPTTAGAYQTALGTSSTQNAFVTKLNPAGTTVVYSTYLGGTSDDSGIM